MGLNRQGRQGRQGSEIGGFGLIEPSAEIDRCARAVIGAAIEVHRHLGPGFLETTYEEAMAVEMSMRGIGFERQVQIPITYKGRVISRPQIDLLVEGVLVVELKAVTAFLPIHVAQIVSYLRAGAFQLGLLINFNVRLLKDGIQRVVSSG
jgi:GxxExxY protein